MKHKKNIFDHSDNHRLLHDFLEGDDGAFAKIYELYARDLYAFGLSLRAKPALIEDAVHDVFTDIYIRREKLAEIRNLKLYIMGAFRNRLFFLLKKEAVYTEMTDSDSHGQKERSNMETWMEKENIDEKELRVKRLMSELNIRQREVLYYRFVDGLSVEDIASLMGINYQSVKNLIHRAIKKLRALQMMILLFLAKIFLRKKQH